jgi:hypothetical protein
MQLTRETTAHATEAAWLAARAKDLTSTECAGLFDAGVYDNARTTYELFHVKSGLIEPVAFEMNERVKWGNRLEASIAQGIAEDHGLIVEAFKVYMRIPELRMGSSFDFKIVGLADGYAGDETLRDMFRKHGQGVLEIKNVDGLQFKRGWIEDGETIEAPPHIELQVAHQLEVADLNWSVIAPLVGGNTPKVVIRERDAELGALIRQKVGAFWAMVNGGIRPKPDFQKDGETIARIYRDNDGSHVDLSDNFHLAELCIAYKAAGAEAKAAEDRKKAAKAEILTIIEAAKSIRAPGFNISAGTNKESYRAYRREAGERWTITKSIVPAVDIEATVAPFRNIRINEAA